MNVDQEILKYECFINDVLKEDLKTMENQMFKLSEELTQFHELKSAVTYFVKLNDKQTPKTNNNEVLIKSLMDIGCNFMAETQVNDVSKIIVNIGLNCYLEFPINDAERYLESRISMANKQIEHLQAKIIKIKSQIKVCLLGMGELQKLH